ncbi:proline dehydrogenase family protein [Streptomyces rubiginosohelvolus]
MLGPVLLAASRSAAIRRIVSAAPVTRPMVDRFVAGERLAESLGAVRSLTARGLDVTLDHLGEDVTDRSEALRSRDAYLALTEALATEDDCRALAGEGSRVRLVKGAYNEPASVAHQDKREVDRAYVRCLKILMAGDGYPMIGSHDPRMVAIAQDLAHRLGRKLDEYEFQMLYGIRVAEQERLVAEGHRMRVYVPYGTDWYGYFMRRLAERPANLTFFLRSLVGRR